MIRALFQSDNSTADHFIDDEFGHVVLRRNAKAKYVRLRMQEDGSLIVTLPRFASVQHAKKLVASSRSRVRTWRKMHIATTQRFTNGDRIGQSHVLHISTSDRPEIHVTLDGLTIRAMHPKTMFITDAKIQNALRPYIKKALQKEARAYLPRQLSYLADMHGFRYARVRYGTQKGRWGSCSTSGTISLNVGLMLLEPELIDYVLIHELCHTKQMNHSSEFWGLVESCLPDYKNRRKLLKQKSPTL